MSPAASVNTAEVRQSASSDELRYVPVGHTFASVTDKISQLVLGRATRQAWFVVFGAWYLFGMRADRSGWGI